MFINDDGLQIIDEEERQARIDFYADHSIGWTARPKHGKDGFVRKGKFKKVCHFILDFFFCCTSQGPICFRIPYGLNKALIGLVPFKTAP